MSGIHFIFKTTISERTAKPYLPKPYMHNCRFVFPKVNILLCLSHHPWKITGHCTILYCILQQILIKHYRSYLRLYVEKYNIKTHLCIWCWASKNFWYLQEGKIIKCSMTANDLITAKFIRITSYKPLSKPETLTEELIYICQNQP